METTMGLVLVDSHAHLAMFPSGEVPALLERAARVGVWGVVVPATGAADLDAALSLGVEYPNRILVAVGVHPHEASSLDAKLKRRLRKCLAESSAVAVGEIGLDYHYMNSPREDQLVALRWQLDLAASAGMPVILHNRDSWSDLAPALRAREGELRGVCHSFAEGAHAAAKVVELGLKVGISGMVTFKRGDNVRSIVRSLAPEHLLVETDSPYLAPTPHRGKQNEPAYVIETSRVVARELGCTLEEIALATTANARSLFQTGPNWPSVDDPGITEQS
ncbi:MAG: TatD family hydrolase [Acidobacteria bacterium]|nr:TatD family hydrolase [Acidobacteriota bacterium]